MDRTMHSLGKQQNYEHNFLVFSALITTSVNVLFAASVRHFVKIFDPSHYAFTPITHCFTRLRKDYANFSNETSFFCEENAKCLPRVRYCAKNELPTTVLAEYVVPLVFICQFLSVVAALVLQYFGNNDKLWKKIC